MIDNNTKAVGYKSQPFRDPPSTTSTQRHVLSSTATPPIFPFPELQAMLGDRRLAIKYCGEDVSYVWAFIAATPAIASYRHRYTNSYSAQRAYLTHSSQEKVTDHGHLKHLEKLTGPGCEYNHVTSAVVSRFETL